MKIYCLTLCLPLLFGYVQGDLLRGARKERKLAKLGNGANRKFPSIERGRNLGNVNTPVNKGNENALKNAAARALLNIAKDKYNLDVEVKPTGKAFFRENGAHIRLTNMVNGIPVDGASAVIHINPDGEILAINGEITSGYVEPEGDILPAREVLDAVVHEYGLDGGEFVGEPREAMVLSQAGELCHAWTQNYTYSLQNTDGWITNHEDTMYGNTRTKAVSTRSI